MKRAIQDALVIALSASVLGLLVYLFHPGKIRISSQRPGTAYSDNSILEKMESETSEEVPVIDIMQVKRLLSEPGTVLVDARLPQQYLQGFIPAAINISYEMLGEHFARLDTLSRENWVITYCDGPPCDKSLLLAMELKAIGFTRVAVYYDGLEDWVLKGETIGKGGEHE